MYLQFLFSWLMSIFYLMSTANFPVVHGLPDTSNLRQLMQNYQENQELIASLGTQYEIVYPVQYRQDWVRGLSTREISASDEVGPHPESLTGQVHHLQKTSIVIETLKHKFHLDLELNVNLLAPTLLLTLQFTGNHKVIEKDVENCYYHATIRNYTNGFAALRTCFGLSGVILLDKELFLIHPLYGDASINHPHLLYHYYHEVEQKFSCGNVEDHETFHCLQEHLRQDDVKGNRYVELALFLDKTFLEKYGETGKDPIAEAIQLVNIADLLYRPIDTSLSIVYLEIWAEDQIVMTEKLSDTLDSLQKYTELKLTRLSVDAAHLLTGLVFPDDKAGMAITDSICTMNAVGITKIQNIFKLHMSSLSISHMIGHNLGMYHDHSCCTCSSKGQCLMESVIEQLSMFRFSSCSVEDYFRTLRKGYGECLYNMPKMRESICGNGILEKEEECDCGSLEACQRQGSCCEPITCKYIKHAECSTGACCKKCKLLSPDHMCRPSRGECDIPEFCNGLSGECPRDLYNKNGVVCDGGLSYCHSGNCPSAKRQCERLWGEGAVAANLVCYERLNIHGTPNGNCGPDGKTGLAKCSEQDSRCGTLQCQQGEKSPILTEKPLEFVINKINIDGTVHECKAIPSLSNNEQENHGLLLDGTKCGYQKYCLNATCAKVKNVPGNCPTSGIDHVPCSGHGVCTNINSCFCHEGWGGHDCSSSEKEIESEDVLSEIINHPILNPGEVFENTKENFRQTLMITIIVISIMIGFALVAALFLIFCKSRESSFDKSSDNYSSCEG